MRHLRPGGALVLLVLAGCLPPPAEVRNPENLARADEEYLLEEYGRAVAHYEQFLSENPGHPARARVLAQLGKCHLGAGRPGPALKAFDEALALNPTGPLHWEVVFRRGVAFRLQGDLPQALEAFRAVSEAPAGERGRAVLDDELHYERALALFRAGDWAAGQEELCAVSPKGPFAARRQARLGLTGYTVQVGAYTDERLARSQEIRLRAVSPGGSIRRLEGERPTYAVCTRPFPSYEEAQGEAGRLRDLGFSDAFVLP